MAPYKATEAFVAPYKATAAFVAPYKATTKGLTMRYSDTAIGTGGLSFEKGHFLSKTVDVMTLLRYIDLMCYSTVSLLSCVYIGHVLHCFSLIIVPSWMFVRT